jgi:hypothetical protein
MFRNSPPFRPALAALDSHAPRARPRPADYIALRDQRACNLWLALVDVTDAMGCLHFEESPLAAPQPLREHWGAGRGTGALQCAGATAGPHLTAAPLRAGSITVHSHLTPHYAKGNTTGAARLGYVVQTRPAASVREARMRGFDHGRGAGNVPGERMGVLEKLGGAAEGGAAAGGAAAGGGGKA